MTGLKAKISEYINLTDKQWNDFSKIHKTIVLEPGDFFLKPGDENSLIAFIQQGVFRHYVIDDKGNEKTTDFCIEGEFTGATDPFKPEINDKYWIEALTESKIITFSSRDLLNYLEKNREIGDVLSKIMLPLLVQKNEREIDLLTKDALGKYRSFLERFPSLEGKINQYYIASYLGISPETLSRIRKKL